MLMSRLWRAFIICLVGAVTPALLLLMSWKDR
jgi:hypothetical protein